MHSQNRDLVQVEEEVAEELEVHFLGAWVVAAEERVDHQMMA